ncbi:HTH-type transcriptional activator Btr [compost metagenome]
MSPRQYLSGLIIRHAKLMLLDNSLSVEAIAHRLGYRDVSHFSKQFKRWTGLPPMSYRQLTAESI